MTAANYEALIDTFAGELAPAEDALVEALRDCDSYRLLANVSIERVAALTAENERLRQCVRRSLENAHDVELQDVPTRGAAA
jgi:hypothetical protein